VTEAKIDMDTEIKSKRKIEIEIEKVRYIDGNRDGESQIHRWK